MDRKEIVEFFETSLAKKIDGNGCIKVLQQGKMYRYKFKDRVVALQYKNPDTKKWERAESFFYTDVDAVQNGKLIMTDKFMAEHKNFSKNA
jgi:hypothetical protein